MHTLRVFFKTPLMAQEGYITVEGTTRRALQVALRNAMTLVGDHYRHVDGEPNWVIVHDTLGQPRPPKYGD